MASTTYDHHTFYISVFTSLASKGANRVRFASFLSVVRNAGQLPQPFWLGAACGGGSCSAARCAAKT
nr:MAG TPA: hypothetical protein [Caudoviricetes sp.]